MGIIRLEDKYKSKYKVQLTPERHYVSSSSGVTGSVYVFPNRSNTQKDNIDERLNLAPLALEGHEFSGATVKAFDSNSLEARREEIYQGNFGKFIGGAFTDALIYEYTIVVSGVDVNGLGGLYTGEFINDEILNNVSWDLYNLSTWGGHYPDNSGPVKAIRLNDRKEFTYQSNDVWVDDSMIIHNRLPESDRDKNGQNFEIALGMLLDGANPFTEDHAWRKGALNSGNSSYTGGSPEDYQFTGFKILEDELGIPYLDSPLTSKEDVNAWPPEVAKWSANVVSNWVAKGYSDLSMHPRNATKKEVILRKANHDLFSSGSLFQKALANRIDDLEVHEAGWWVHNDHSLCLSKYTDSTGAVKEPALGYYNKDDQYTIDWAVDEVTFEFWIKPCKEQLDVGTVVSLKNNYAICIIPDEQSIQDGIYQTFKLGIYAQDQVSNTDVPTIGDIHLGGATNPNKVTSDIGVAGGGIYVTTSALKLEKWHHIVVRYGSLFNNGLLSVYVDSVRITDGNVDGLYDGVTRTEGIFDITLSNTPGVTMLLGGWPANNEDRIFGGYADSQELKPLQTNGNPVYTYSESLGKGVVPQRTLKSELKEFRLWSVARTERDILVNKYQSLSSTTGMFAYIPFFFDPRNDTPQWTRLGHIPFENNPQSKNDFYGKGNSKKLDSTNVSYNPVQYCTNSAHIVGMPFVNVHSHLREYVNGGYPVILQHDIYSSPTNTTAYPAILDQTYSKNRLSYFVNNWSSLPWLKSINSMILPSDCEDFECNYSLVSNGIHMHLDPAWLKLQGAGVGSTSNEYELKNFFDDEIFAIQDTIVKLDPKLNKYSGTVAKYGTSPMVSEGRLTDADFLFPISTVISVPQIYYGNRIKPDSVILKFTINEEGKEITIVDFEGSLYRAKSDWTKLNSKVGHIDYANGIICIFSPLLTNIGLENFDLKFKGEKNLHVMQLDIPCAAGVANKSQHPTYKKLKPSANANETESNLTYISTIYLHDENLNIIGKVNLAQPVQKREEDSFIFRVKVDF